MRVADVSRQITSVLGECLEAVSAELSFIPLENAFELFGGRHPPRRRSARLCLRRGDDGDFPRVTSAFILVAALCRNGSDD